MYYLIEEKKYLDNFMIRERLKISKSLFQQLTCKYKIEERDVIKIQNRKLYSLYSIVKFLKKVVNENE